MRRAGLVSKKGGRTFTVDCGRFEKGESKAKAREGGSARETTRCLCAGSKFEELGSGETRRGCEIRQSFGVRWSLCNDVTESGRSELPETQRLR